MSDPLKFDIPNAWLDDIQYILVKDNVAFHTEKIDGNVIFCISNSGDAEKLLLNLRKIRKTFRDRIGGEEMEKILKLGEQS